MKLEKSSKAHHNLSSAEISLRNSLKSTNKGDMMIVMLAHSFMNYESPLLSLADDDENCWEKFY